MNRLPEPQVVPTSRGPVELAAWGEGPAVLSLHGAMGGHDRATLLAWTIGASRRRKLEEYPDQAVARAIPDASLRRRTLGAPEAGRLVRALLASTWDRMASRLSGTELDADTSWTRTYPLDRIAVPTLLVRGTADETVPFETHATLPTERIPGAELLAIPDGRHITLFSNRDEVRAKVTASLRAHAPKRAMARPDAAPTCARDLELRGEPSSE